MSAHDKPFDEPNTDSEIAALKAERDARRESLAQEIRETLRTRKLWSPTVAADLITAVAQAIDNATARAERAEAETQEQARLNGMGAEREAKLLAEIETLKRQAKAGEISDGYHTHKELYEHRHLLWLLVTESLIARDFIVFKTWKNRERELWDGWFILGVQTKYGQLTYHMPSKYWDMSRADVLESNIGYDGHNSFDVLERLDLLLKEGM